MEIKPLKKFDKVIYPPPDKSITHRAIMLNVISEGRATITNALLGQDCLSTISCLERLGAEIAVHDKSIAISGGLGSAYQPSRGEGNRSTILDCGNSGTTARLLMGLLCPRRLGRLQFCGDSSLSARPMSRVIEPLRRMGAKITCEHNSLPLLLDNCSLEGIDYSLPIPSAQVKSAILLAGLGASKKTIVREQIVSRNHTELMLCAMGADIVSENNCTTISKSTLQAMDICVPNDISSASYLLVLAAILEGSRVVVKDVGINPTRTGVLDILQSVGADISISNMRQVAGEDVADITVKYSSSLKPFRIDRELVPRLIDEIPVLAVLACCISGTSVISGAEELMAKESNRIDAVVTNLARLGADIVATADGMIVNGKRGRLEGGTVTTYLDHRIAMSMAIAGCYSNKGVRLDDSSCVAISYPNFFEDIQ